MKLTFYYFFLLTLALSLNSCNKSSGVYKDEKGNFTIRFGGEPDTTSEDQAFGFGSFKWKVATYKPEEDINESYSVSYLDLPKHIITSDSLRLLPQFFGITQTDYLSKFGEQSIASEFKRTLKKYPGREYVWMVNNTKKAYTRRYYLVKNRLYRLEVSYPFKQQHNNKITQFFSSFKLNKIKTNPNPEKQAPKTLKNFTIDFPGTTTVRMQEAYGIFGLQSLRTEGYECPGGPDVHGNLVYMVNSSALPKEIISELNSDQLKELLTQNFRENKMVQSGAILKDGEVIVNGVWCHEGHVHLELGDGNQMIMQLRSFIIGNYLYQIVVGSVARKQNNPEAMKFMSSFRVE